MRTHPQWFHVCGVAAQGNGSFAYVDAQHVHVDQCVDKDTRRGGGVDSNQEWRCEIPLKSCKTGTNLDLMDTPRHKDDSPAKGWGGVRGAGSLCRPLKSLRGPEAQK